VYGLGIELPRGVSEPSAIDLPHHVSCRPFVEDRPTAGRISVRSSPRPPEEKHRRMLRLNDERFQPTWGDDPEV